MDLDDENITKLKSTEELSNEREQFQKEETVEKQLEYDSTDEEGQSIVGVTNDKCRYFLGKDYSNYYKKKIFNL